VAADADTEGAYKDSALLLILVRSLLTRFRTTIDTLNAQLNLTVEQKLKFLEEKEARDQQDASEQALPAFRKAIKYVPPHKRGNRDLSPNSESGATSGIQCYLCDEPHYMRDCSKLVKARKLLRECEAEKKRRKEKLSFPKLSKPPVKPGKSNKRTGKAYGAEEAKSESELETSTNISDSEDEEIETCRLSKDILGKASPSTWAGDTGASSHMSDQPSLFRRMIKIKRRLV
jgi:hypothetical protein